MFRSVHFVIVTMLAGLIAAASPAWGQANRVAPDPKIVQLLQDIQTACDRKDTTKYSQLIAKEVVVSVEPILPGLTTEKMTLEKFTAQWVTAGDANCFSPFVDATPVSKRILYAQNIPGGQRLRVIMLNQPVKGANQTVGWVMDLSVTNQGGRLLLTELCPLPTDFANQVWVPAFKEFSAKAKSSTASDALSEVVAIYNKYWKVFAATLPKPEAMPTGIDGKSATPATSTAVVKPAVTETKPPVVVVKPAVRIPPPPAIRVPTRPTAVTVLPSPPPVRLPDAQVTPRVRQLRSQIDAAIRRDFIEFANRLLLETYWLSAGQRYFVNVYQNRWQASYGTITVIFTIRLVFIQPPRGPMTTYMVPIMESQTPTPSQPPAIPQTPIALPPPAEKVSGCMVLTDTAKLRAKHGADRFEQIRQYLQSFGEIIDLAGQNIGPRDYQRVDAIVEQSFKRDKNDCLFIFGNHDIVPFGIYRNPTYDPSGDPDMEILSDDVYGDFDHDAQNDPEIMVVRMPDDPGILADTNSVLYRPSASSGKITLSDYAIYGNQHRSTPSLLATIADPGGSGNLLLRSTPTTADNLPANFFQGHNAFIDLHGGNDPSQASMYLGEEDDANIKPVAMTADQAVAPDGLVLCTACYGGSIVNISGSTVTPKSSDTQIAMRFLRNGASGFVGYTRIAWQSCGPNALQEAEGFAARRMVELTRQGQSPQKAFQMTKREMASAISRGEAAYANMYLKMYHQMVYYGLPPTGNRQISPVATPDRPSSLKTQLVRVAEQASDAAKNRDANSLAQLMTPTIRDGITNGPDVNSADEAQRIINLMSQPDSANPLADKSAIDQQLFLVEKAPDNDYVASFRVPFQQSVLADNSGSKEPLNTVVRLKFRQEGDQMKISGWESRNEDYVQKVAQPYVQWIKQNNITNPAEAKDKYEDLVESFIDGAVMKASQSKTDLTAAINPLAPQGDQTGGPSGGMTVWMIVALTVGGAMVLLCIILPLALRGRRSPARAAPAWPTVRMTTITPGIGGMPAGVTLDDGQPSLALSPAGERGRRRNRLLLIGLALLASFCIPDLSPGDSGGVKAVFTNILALGDSTVPAMVKFFLAFPAAAALLTMILALIPPGRVRGVLLAAAASAPVIVALIKKGSGIGPSQTLVDAWPSQSCLAMAAIAGMAALWVGSRCRWYRPASAMAYLVGLGGAIAFGVSQAIPTSVEGAKTQIAVDLFQMIRGSSTTGPKVLAVFMLAGLALAAMASLLALFNLPGRRASIRGVAKVAFWLVFFGALTLLGCTLAPVFQGLGGLSSWALVARIVALLRASPHISCRVQRV